MFRTRDFLLIFGAVVFLLVAIGTTLFSQQAGTEEQAAAIQFSEGTDTAYVAVLPDAPSLSRDERVADMRRKIAEAGELVIAAPEVGDTVTEATDTETETPIDTVSKPAIQKCPVYNPYQGNWSPQGITMEASEGARVVYRVAQAVAPLTEGSKEVLLQLPLYPMAGAPTCVGSDVVGIAQDGSLIRNHEVGLYGVFGENTLIGYALDGFPIYGTSEQNTDACGGSLAAGGYRYYLSDTREMILHCFMAAPVRL